MALLDAGPVHAGIHVEKNSDPAVAPLRHLLFILGQDGNASLRELLSDFLHPPRIRAYRRMREKYIARTVAAGHQQFQGRRALETADATLDQHSKSETQFRGLDV